MRQRSGWFISSCFSIGSERKSYRVLLSLVISCISWHPRHDGSDDFSRTGTSVLFLLLEIEKKKNRKLSSNFPDLWASCLAECSFLPRTEFCLFCSSRIRQLPFPQAFLTSLRSSAGSQCRVSVQSWALEGSWPGSDSQANHSIGMTVALWSSPLRVLVSLTSQVWVKISELWSYCFKWEGCTVLYKVSST